MQTLERTDDPSLPELLSTIGYCLVCRFLRCGSTADLESAVKDCYAAVSSHSSLSAVARAGNMNRLSFALFTRYQQLGDKTDRIRAKAYLQEALELCPAGHPGRISILNNYARVLGNIERGDSDLSDVELAIQYFYEALATCDPHIRPRLLTNLAVVLLHRYSHVGNPSDVDTAFSLCKISLDLLSEHHPDRGLAFLVQAKAVIAMCFGKRTAVYAEMALDILHAAQDALTPGQPLFIETYMELSHVYSLRHHITTNDADLEDAFKYQIAAARYTNGGSRLQLEAAMEWVESAEKYNHTSTLDAYRSAISILDAHIVSKPSLELQYDIVASKAPSICVDATSCALKSGNVVAAVELFEHSRGLLWTFIGHLRTPVDELRARGPSGRDLADEFENLSRQLEMLMALGDNEEDRQKFRCVQNTWNASVDKIRALDGFGRFLLPPSYEDLRLAAVGGPVIILNASRYSCDAIIVLAHADPIHIPFKVDIFVLSSMFHSIRRDVGRGEKEEKLLAGLLRWLWDSVVREVVRALEPHVPKNSRIWWCLSGAFTSLPIHAAHPYRKGERGLSDIYVSSYTPTLSALIRSLNRRDAPQGIPNFVTVGQLNLITLTHAQPISDRQELDLIPQHLPDTVQITELTGRAATAAALLTALDTHTYAHLALPWQYVPGRPFTSNFAVYGRERLTLLDIIHSRAGRATEYAFLATCQSAAGGVGAPDETIHLAAALQLAGVKHVAGAMWFVSDQEVVHTMEAFYQAMRREDGVFDPARTARALRMATRVTKDRVSLEQRIVFIHIGP